MSRLIICLCFEIPYFSLWTPFSFFLISYYWRQEQQTRQLAILSLGTSCQRIRQIAKEVGLAIYRCSWWILLSAAFVVRSSVLQSLFRCLLHHYCFSTSKATILPTKIYSRWHTFTNSWSSSTLIENFQAQREVHVRGGHKLWDYGT